MPDYRVTVTLLTSAEAPGEAGHKALTLLSSARQKEAGVRFERSDVHRLSDAEAEVVELRDELRDTKRKLSDANAKVEHLEKRYVRRGVRPRGRSRRVGVYQEDGYWTCRFCEAWNRDLLRLEHSPYCRGGER